MADRMLPCPMGTCHRCDAERRAKQDARCLAAREAWKLLDARKQSHGPQSSRWTRWLRRLFNRPVTASEPK